MAGKKLAVNVLVLDAEGNPKLLEKDSEVPAEHADQVGEHCFADAPAAKRTTSK